VERVIRRRKKRRKGEIVGGAIEIKGEEIE
jgi:hypothetical protein